MEKYGSDGFGEGAQHEFALDDAVVFHRLMLELYNYRCAITGKVFSQDEANSELEVFLFQPLVHGGRMWPGNAIVVESVAAGLLGKGHILVSDAYRLFPSHPEIGGMPADPDIDEGSTMTLPDNVSLWPDRVMLAYHRSLFRAQ